MRFYFILTIFILAGLSASERKKAMRKARKAELMKGNIDNQNTPKSSSTVSPSTTSSTANNNPKKKIDEDPEGLTYLNVEDYLTESKKFLNPLLQLAAERIESQILGCDVYLRKSKSF